MVERIEEIRKEAEAAIAAATTTDEFEQLRVRYLGRKAELPNILRGIAELPGEERGPVGKAGNEARVRLRTSLGGRGPSWTPASSGRGSPRTRSTSRCRARRRSPPGRSTR